MRQRGNSALNEITTYNWNETLGLLNSETTVVGRVNGAGGTARTTSYTYNGWGQLVETKYPDGIRKANVVQWNSDATATYYIYSESSGSAPVWTYFDNKGREVRKETKGLNGNTIRVFTTYRADGKVDKVSDPTFNASFDPTTNPGTTYGYNADYGYLESVTTPMGTTKTEYSDLTTTVTSPEGTSSTVTNAAGQTLNSTVNGKKVTYAYYPSGLTHTSTPTGGQALTMAYNLQGKRTSLNDPDGGTIETVYDGFGELVTEKQKIRNNTDYITTTNTYDDNGLLLNINRNGEITTNTYDANIKTRVNAIELKDKNSKVLNRQTFTYDPTKITDRVTNVLEEIADINGNLRTYNTGKVYDALGRVKKEIYPSGYYTINTYDSYSNLLEVRDEVGSGHSIWKADTENEFGQATGIYKGSKKTTYSYDPVNHQTTSIQADGVIDYSYGYYAADGTNHANNLEWRADGIKTQSEHFIYDTQNRLTNWNVTGGGQTIYNSMSFDTNGNINHKSDLGAFTLKYGGEKEDGTGASSTIKYGVANGALIGTHALTTIWGVPASPFPQTDLAVTYTDFKKIATLDEGTKDYELTYGVDDQRRMSVYYANGKTQGVAPTLTRYYLGDYEEEIGANGKVRKIHYLSGAILIQNEGKADSLLYTYSDAQGSLIVLTDADGNLLTKSINGADVEIGRFAYDPWGARRNPNDWNVKDSRTSFIINRGYTGHEHLDAFGIINMNGRVYDPLTAQFFSPDPYVQAPGNWVNYNRYGYCMGNPLKYTDPSGEFFFLIPNIGWSKSGGLSIGLTAIVGIPGIISAQASVGYSIKSNDFSATVGATALFNTVYLSYSSQSGFSTGWSVGLSPQMGLPISTNFFSVGANYNITHDSWSGNVSAWGVDKNGWTFNPSVSVMIFPEHTTNFVKGKGFNSNDKVLYNFIHGYNDKDWSDDIGTEGANWYSAALKYFGIKGKYQKEPPGNNSNVEGNTTYYGATSPSTGQMYFGDLAFSSFDNLQQTYYKENFTSQRVQNRQKLAISNDSSDNKYYPEEALGFEYAYKNSGLYPNATANSYQLANSYWFQVYGVTLINQRNPLYSIPRLW